MPQHFLKVSSSFYLIADALNITIDFVFDLFVVRFCWIVLRVTWSGRCEDIGLGVMVDRCHSWVVITLLHGLNIDGSNFVDGVTKIGLLYVGGFVDGYLVAVNNLVIFFKMSNILVLFMQKYRWGQGLYTCLYSWSCVAIFGHVLGPETKTRSGKVTPGGCCLIAEPTKNI